MLERDLLSWTGSLSDCSGLRVGSPVAFLGSKCPNLETSTTVLFRRYRHMEPKSSKETYGQLTERKTSM